MLSGCFAGDALPTGSPGRLSDTQRGDIAAIKAANVAYQVTKAKAGHDEQVAIGNARATLQATGDVGAA